MKNFGIASILGFAGLAAAHMEISQPPPLRSKFNEFTTDVDYSMTNPLSNSGDNFPCKGYHNLVGTPQGQSVVTYTPGQSYEMTITGGTIHNGGSCQISLSYDNAQTWTVIHSYIGNCPAATGDTNYPFTVPSDAPTGEALFAWSWFNNIGNREMYMNCAVVTIGGGRAKSKRQSGWDSRPDMFVANVGNGCGTTEGTDLEFPNPGPDVTRAGSNGAPPTGSCAGGKASKAVFQPVPKAPTTLLKKARPAPTARAAKASNCEFYPGTTCEEGSLVRSKSPASNYAKVLRESEAKSKQN
jgi:hypothetical protein